MRTIARLLVLFVLIILCASFAPAALVAQATFSSDLNMPGRDLLQFTSAGHVLGFRPTGIYVTSGSGLLRLEFAGTAGVAPTATTLRSGNGGAPPLEPVTYPELWNGISATFQPVAGGILKSTYALAPAAQVADIHLRYNVPVQVDSLGGLTLRLPTGEYQESAPIAWQDIAGERIPVEAAFQSLAEREIGFRLGSYNPAYPLVIDPTLQWNTFLGSTGDDAGTGIAMDASGNIYVVGSSNATWGSPIRPFNLGTYDAFVAKLSSTGTMMWSTFLGGSGWDTPKDIALDNGGNIYVVGNSRATWGDAPKRPYTGHDDAFVAKLNNDGALVWNTFLGGLNVDDGTGIALDASGNIYITGSSNLSWGTLSPLPYTASYDGFVAKLGGDGTLLWNSFLGGSNFDTASGIAVDGSGNTYISGTSNASWGLPLRGFTTGSADAFVAKLNSSGFLQWNTFLGSAAYDGSPFIARNASGGIYVAGISNATWGDAPRRSYTEGSDGFVAELDDSGALLWNTFLGGSDPDYVRAILLDASSYAYIIGDSGGSWGSPLQPFGGYSDVTVSKVDSTGNLLWNTFLGGTDSDLAYDGAIDASGNIVVTGYGYASWGSPLESFHGTTSADAFVAVMRKENSTTTLTAHTPSPSLPGQTVTISYTVAADPPGSLTPTGSVIVGDGTISCMDTIAVGHCDLAFATAGTKSLTATYAGNTDFVGSSSAATGHQVNKASTTTSITGHTPTLSLPGQAVTISYTVAAVPPNSLTPTGSVTISDGTVSCTALAAVGHCALTFATAGAKSLTATYAGDTNFVGSTSTALAHKVNKANTTTSITGHTPAPSIVGQAYTVSWTVSVTPPATGTPTGTVTINDGSGGSCTAAIATGYCALASTSPGTKVLTGTYSGDSSLNGSSGTATHEVKNEEIKNNEYRLYLPLLRR